MDFVDVSLGHFELDTEEGRYRFFIDTPLWNDPMERAAGDELEVGSGQPWIEGTHLVYDTSRFFLGRWCVIPLQVTEVEDIELMTTFCGEFEGCDTPFALMDLIEFSKMATKTGNCERAASKHLGLAAPEIDTPGCSSARSLASGAVLVLAGWLVRRSARGPRRRD